MMRNYILHRVLTRCRQVNLKLNKDKYHFRCTSILFFGEKCYNYIKNWLHTDTHITICDSIGNDFAMANQQIIWKDVQYNQFFKVNPDIHDEKHV